MHHRRNRPIVEVFVLAGMVATAACDGNSPAPVPDTGSFTVRSVVSNTRPLLPVSGGTLLVSRDENVVLASDPDRDAVWLVRMPNGSDHGSTTSVALMAGDEPGRAVEDDSQRVHVVLRRGGAVATIDLTSGNLVARSPVCAAPRGIAWDSPRGVLFVACADGELLTLSGSSGRVIQIQQLPDDLRDVVVDGDHLLVSRFRTAQVLVVQPDAPANPPTVLNPPMFSRQSPTGEADGVFEPEVAWRMVPDPLGGAMIVYQRKSAISTDLGAPGARQAPPDSSSSGGYGSSSSDAPPVPSPCDPADLIHTTLAHVAANGFSPSPTLPSTAALPVDLAIDPSGALFAIASALQINLSPQGNVISSETSQLQSSTQCARSVNGSEVPGRPVAVAFFRDGRLAVQTQGPSTITVAGQAFPLDNSREDTGFSLFHDSFSDRMSHSGHVACASCHPEGGDDGQVWSFDGQPMRTQSLRGGILGDAPFHWDGSLSTFNALAHETMPQRMDSAVPDPEAVSALATWVNAIPRTPASSLTDAASIARGRSIFFDGSVGCASCHFGARFSNHTLVDVGTGGTFKVPSLLGVGMRGPWMHNGCARTLAQRFDPNCGGGDHHGHTSQLSQGQTADLVAYLQSL